MSELLTNITNARETAAGLAGVAGQYAANEPSVIDALNSKIREAYASNQDLIGKLDTSTQEYYNAPKAGRELYQNIFNPFQRENLVSQYTGVKALPMLSQANLLGSRLGGIEGLVNAGVRGYQAQTGAAQAKAQLAQQNYQNLLNEYQLQEQLNAVTTQEMEINGRRYLVTLDRNGNIKNKVDLGPAKSSGSGTDTASFLANLKALGINFGEGTGGVEEDVYDIVETPTTTPQTGVFGNYTDPIERLQAQNKLFGGISGVNFGGIPTGGGIIGAGGY